MILLDLILILVLGGLLAWFTGRWSAMLPRIISLIAITLDLILLFPAYLNSYPIGQTSWLIDYKVAWIPHFGINLHLALDGLSMILLVLTLFLGLISVLISWKEIREKSGFFHFNILWILAGITGVFLSLDLFLFYFFWELMLVPMYFLIGIYGHENRIYASFKFFIYTQAGGLLMFLAILALYFIHGRNTAVYTFDYMELFGTSMSGTASFLIMLGFLAAFLIKLPVVPLHNWLPDAHTEAPTAGSVILAGLLLKTGAYGLLRFVIPLFPQSAASFAPYGMILGVIGILYGAKLAYAQTDLKRLVAYTSVSHMGFVMLGVFSFNVIALQGVVIQIIAHAISTGGLFIMVGQLQERIHIRDLNKMGGLWNEVPVMGSMGLIFTLASLGLPGLGNFIAEFFILTGTFKVNVLMACLASLGLIASMIYSLRIVQKVFLGKEVSKWEIPDLSVRENIVFASLVIAIIYIGLTPQQVLKTAEPSLTEILNVKGKTDTIRSNFIMNEAITSPQDNEHSFIVKRQRNTDLTDP
ncbi:MAG TPA: NADH-quinone oxidoreductase subunit M [Prolixibacteraceae bacterium]|nr:NADH-quinone oxidoreductase subunit M [Prolixibacteraceae bacterium]